MREMRRVLPVGYTSDCGSRVLHEWQARPRERSFLHFSPEGAGRRCPSTGMGLLSALAGHHPCRLLERQGTGDTAGRGSTATSSLPTRPISTSTMCTSAPSPSGMPAPKCSPAQVRYTALTWPGLSVQVQFVRHARVVQNSTKVELPRCLPALGN